MLATIHHSGVSVSASGVIIGLLLGALVFVVGSWLAQETGVAVLRPVSAILAVVVFLMCGFDF